MKQFVIEKLLSLWQSHPTLQRHVGTALKVLRWICTLGLISLELCLIAFCYEQHLTTTYEVTDGKIVRSTFRTTSWWNPKTGKEEFSYSPDIEYEYVVGGICYRGSRRRVHEAGYDGGADKVIPQPVQQILSWYPVGAKVKTYYDHRHPEIAVLETGINGMDLFFPLLLVPFGILLLAWWGIGSVPRMVLQDHVYSRYARQSSNGWKIVLQPVGYTRSTMVCIGMFVFLLIIFSSALGGGHPTVPYMLSVYSVVLVAFLILVYMTHSPAQSIEINDWDLTLKFPRANSLPIPAQSITAIDLVPLTPLQDSNNGQEKFQIVVRYNDRLDGTDIENSSPIFPEGVTREQAKDVANWIRGKLSLPARI